jgi:radical SAM superfamily enzyme YgiQ (UPF0313 family)
LKYDLILFSDISRPLHGKGMGVYRLANHLRSNNFRVKVIHGFIKLSDEDFFDICSKFITNETLLVGLGATVLADLEKSKFFGIEDHQVEQRFRQIKKLYPTVSLCVGGAQITGVSDSFLQKYNYFDYAIKGQGENSLLALLNYLRSGSKITFNTITKPKILTDKTYPFDNFNTSFNEFTDVDAVQQGEGLPIEIARGCIFKCKFCGYDLIGKKMGDYTKLGNLIREELIKNYQKWGTKDYYIADETINDSEEKINMLYDAVKDLDFRPTFGGFLRLDLIWKYPEMAKKLLDIGLNTCSFGIETINDQSGKAVGKGLGKKRIEETLDYLKTVWDDKVFVNASFILGLKYDTPETAIELNEWLDQQFSKGTLHTVFVKPLYIMPSNGASYLDQHYLEQGYRLMEIDGSIPGSDRVRTVVEGDCLSWETDNYNYVKASEDADKIHIKFNQRKICKGKIAKHNFAFVKSLLPEQYKDQLLASMIYDIPFEGLSIKETEDLIYQLDQEHYKRYLDLVKTDK